MSLGKQTWKTDLCSTVYMRENRLKVMIIKAVDYMFGGFKNNTDDPLVHKNSEPLTFHSFFRDTCANIYLWQVHLKFLWHLTNMFQTIRFFLHSSFNSTLKRFAFIQEFLRSFINSALVFVLFMAFLRDLDERAYFFLNFECKTMKFVLTEGIKR